MRYAADRKEQSRKEIVAKAADRLRRDGIAAVGLRTLMTDAGLTHGAFYAHFDSRADLVADAIAEALAQTRELLAGQVEAAPPEKQLEAFIKAYLRRAHRDHIDQGCAAAALAPEIGRLDPEVRARFADGVAAFATLLEPHLPAGGSHQTRLARAHAVFAGMMGTLQLARLVLDPALSDAILVEGRAAALAAARAGE